MADKKDTATPRNIADKEQVEKAGKKKKNRELQIELDLKSILDLPAGRRVLLGIIMESGYNDRISGDTESIQFYVGRRDVGLTLVKSIGELSPAMWIEMQREALITKDGD